MKSFLTICHSLAFFILVGSCLAGLTNSDYLYISGDQTYAPPQPWEENVLFYSGDKAALRFGYTDDMPEYLLSLSNIGSQSFAFGQGSRAIGSFSFASGYYTDATASYAWASGNQSDATGTYSRAHGYSSLASGYASVAMGYDTTASGSYTAAFGKGKATAIGAFAGGYYTEANHNYSTAFGYYTESFDAYQFVVGRKNDSYTWLNWDFDEDGTVDTNPAYALFVVGNGGVTYGDGLSTPTTSNAFIVYEDGTARTWGDIIVEGEIFGAFGGTDFVFGLNDGRDQGPSKPQQRALVHTGPDELHINYNGDFEGGTVIEGDVRFSQVHGGISMGVFN